MKNRLLWFAILIVGGAALYFGIARPHTTTIPKTIRDPIADLKPALPSPPALPPPVVADIPKLQPPPLPPVRPRAPNNALDVPIQPGATIDFSTGAPMVRSGGADDEALARALKEMAEATQHTKFEPAKPPAAEK